jgi:hypothetical protein
MTMAGADELGSPASIESVRRAGQETQSFARMTMPVTFANTVEMMTPGRGRPSIIAKCLGCRRVFDCPKDIADGFRFCRQLQCIKMLEAKRRVSENWIPDLPQSDMDFARLHEACHVVICRRLGGHVSAVLVCHDLDGFVISSQPKSGGLASIWAQAVTSAVGAVFDSAFHRDPRWSQVDRDMVADSQKRYRELSGGLDMPDPYTSARAVLNQPGVYENVLLLARNLIPGKVLSGQQIDDLLGE